MKGIIIFLRHFFITVGILMVASMFVMFIKSGFEFNGLVQVIIMGLLITLIRMVAFTDIFVKHQSYKVRIAMLVILLYPSYLGFSILWGWTGRSMKDIIVFTIMFIIITVVITIGYNKYHKRIKYEYASKLKEYKDNQ